MKTRFSHFVTLVHNMHTKNTYIIMNITDLGYDMIYILHNSPPHMKNYGIMFDTASQKLGSH